MVITISEAIWAEYILAIIVVKFILIEIFPYLFVLVAIKPIQAIDSVIGAINSL